MVPSAAPGDGRTLVIGLVVLARTAAPPVRAARPEPARPAFFTHGAWTGVLHMP
jgi:hypothetical protein